MARQIEAYKLRTELAVDASKGTAAMKSFQKDVDNVGQSFKKLGPQIDASLKGKDAGAKFGKNFSGEAVAEITSSFKELGKTLGSIIGTVVMPGIGTAVGSTIGEAIDTAFDKASGPVKAMIARGIELNKVLESTRVEFTSFTGNAEEADKYLNQLLETSKKTGILPQNLIEASESLYDFTQNLKLTDVILRASIEQAADIGGGPEKLRAVADALGLIAEKGDLTAQALRPLYKLKVNPLERLSQELGLSLEKVKKLAAEGRISGPGAAEMISRSILREKAGFAAKLAGTTTQGAEDVFAARSTIVAAEGTKTGTAKYGQYLRQASDAITGPGAEKAAQYLDQQLARIFDLTERGVSSGKNLIDGLSKGLTSSDAVSALEKGLYQLKDLAGTAMGKVFEKHSPSEWTAREVGIPLGQGMAIGIIPGFVETFEKLTGPALKEKIDEWIKKYAEQYQVPEALIRGVMKQETGHLTPEKSVRARSPKGALGPMQLMKGTANRFGVKNRLDPEQNIEGGTKYLRFLMDLFGANNIDKILAGYNAGEGAVQKYGGVPPYAETQNYVRQIKGRMGQGGMALPAGTTAAPSQTQADSAVAAWKQFMDQLSPEARKQLNDLGIIIQQTMKEIAATDAQLRAARGGLGKDPGTGRAFEQGVSGQTRQAVLVQSLEEKSKKLNESLHTLSVSNTQLIELYQAEYEAQKQLAAEKQAALNPILPKARSIEQILGNLGDRVLPEIPSKLNEVATSLSFTGDKVLELQMGLPPLAESLTGVAAATVQVTALSEDYQKQMRDQYVKGRSLLDQLSGPMGQAASMVPSEQQVGKKRGLFSKILGIAAPFLSFIPGAGPILSTIAGAASQGLAGNWGGALSAAAGGFAKGGAFNPGRSGPSTPVGGIVNNTAQTTQLAAMTSLIPRRAAGGPVYRGQRYIVGEAGSETFTPLEDGYISPHGAGGGGADMVTAAAELRAAVAHLSSMPAHQVVMRGARGLVPAMDRDAGLIRLMGQRQRLA